MAFQKICESSVTEAIAKAMENADRMKQVVIIYETNDDQDTSHGVICQGNITREKTNYLLDIAKEWVLRG